MGLRENIWKDTVARLELKTAVVVPPHAKLRDVIAGMRQGATGCALVCDRSGIVGIFTERDLVKRVFAKKADLDRPVSETMTARPVTVRQTDTIGWAIRTMVKGHYRHLPVVDGDGMPLGTLSARGIIHYLVEHVPLSVYNLPPRPGQVQQAREGA